MTSGLSKSPANKGAAIRHIPQRTCVNCRQSTFKRRLVRVVRLASGSVQVDPTGKKSGRGAYLCWDPRCWETALKKNILERALKTAIGLEDRAALDAYARGICEEQANEDNTPSREVQ